MVASRILALVFVACVLLPCAARAEKDASLCSFAETNLSKSLKEWELNKTGPDDAPVGDGWVLRSHHFVFGMPCLTDARHDFTPEGYGSDQAGISVLVREGFVVAHFDRMRSPLWVSQRWTRFDHARMLDTEPQVSRPWRVDLELPDYASGGYTYNGDPLDLDRGHMAPHSLNRAWGIDSSNWGCRMSNSTPQHRKINRDGGPWYRLEFEVRDVVADLDNDIDAVWIISGAAYRDTNNPAGETPEQDFQDVVRLPEIGFGVPHATYKIVGWFDGSHRFQARAYIFEQPHTVDVAEEEFTLIFTLGSTHKELDKHLVTIDEVEKRMGIDFFPLLDDDIEDLIEGTDYDNLWGLE